MKYNHADTVYYKASKKLLQAGQKILQTDKLGWLLQVIPRICFVEYINIFQHLNFFKDCTRINRS